MYYGVVLVAVVVVVAVHYYECSKERQLRY